MRFFECAKPGMFYKNAYYRFGPEITRLHLRNLRLIRDMTIPEPLFGTLVENAIPKLSSYADVSHQEALEDFVTLPDDCYWSIEVTLFEHFLSWI